ncbi:MAG: PAS domain S-box protein [Acidobacteriia bacterium]|nr:PAS domain S-box protein [Terriglobia bacterium]
MNPLSPMVEADFGAFVDAIPDAVAIVDERGRIVLVNKQTEKLFGYAATELTGQPIEILIPERFRQNHPHHRKSFEQNPRARPMGTGLDLFGLRKNHSEFPVEISLSPLKTRTNVMAIAAIRDVTERKEREEALWKLNRRLEAEKAYRSLVEHAPYGIYRSGIEDDNFLAVNPALMQMLGYEHEHELLCLSIGSDVYRDPADRVAHLELTRKHRHFQGLEVEWKRKDGSPLFVRLSGRRGSEESGPEYLDVVAEDVTQRRKLEEQFQKAQRLEAIARLAGGVAHDFNNLLGVITGYAYMLLSDVPGGPIRDKVDGILQATGSAATLTRDLLAVSRSQVLQPTVLDLNVVVKDTEKILLRVISEDIRLRHQLEPQLGRVKLDRTQIEQVLLNLVINARDAMPAGGEIRIQTANAHLDESYSNAHAGVQAGDYVVLEVVDSGKGMDRATQARVFEPFFTTKSPDKGTGLGLASVYGIVHQSGGHIWLYSEPGIGTTFKIYFPRVYDRAETAAARRPPATFRGTETVLLVEDHALLRKVTTEMIRAMGYTVLVADGPEAALEIARNHDIHLLVSDVVMPDMNGLTLRDKIVAMRPQIRTLLMSGYSGDVISQYGDIGSETGLLAKPFTVESLGAQMRSLLDLK